MHQLGIKNYKLNSKSLTIEITGPGGCLFSTRKSRSEVPERGDFGEDNCLGNGGVDRAKTKEKRMHKRRTRESLQQR